MIVMVIGVIFLVGRLRQFSFMKKLSKGSKKKAWLFSVLLAVVVAVILAMTLNTMNMIIVMIHLAIFFALVELACAIIVKIRKKPFEKYYAGGVALALAAVYLLGAAYMAYHVDRTVYTLSSEKVGEPFRIVQFADSHIGSTFDAEGFRDYVKQMSAEKPDVVVITGDFIDDDTSRDDMIDACGALRELQTKFGVYYVYGNHDKGYYGDAARGYSAEEFAGELEKNGVTILEDEHVVIDGRVNLIGRQDDSETQRGGGRANLETLMADVDQSKYCVVLDHQPKEYAREKEQGADLVLSGHTHGGQMIPVLSVGEWIGANDMTYGLRQDGATNYIVTSGISDWALKFKTGCKSEYVVIDLKGIE